MYQPDQLVPAALKEAGLEPAVVDDVVGRMDEAQFQAATSLLLTVLDSEEAGGRVIAVDPVTHQPRPLHGAQEGLPVAFDVTESFKESFFPIAGLVATFIATDRPDAADAPGGADALRAFWSKLIALTPRQDDDAIAVARAVGTLATRATHAYSELSPSTADIASETGLSGPELVAALRRLCDLGVMANVEWAGQRDDYANPGNRWRFTA